ncbi:MAG: 2-oxoacid:acceptor oxidoreductase family protein [candidate division NC10 bacterium]|nr:2-oxoacid:acceptor oxidoreductase family protein [candidate division NC10 bacterium]
MPYRYEIRLSGEGGQGLVLAGLILAEAAAIYDGINATQTQAYGPESRGGASKSEVIISDEEIDYPKATQIDLLLALTQEACNKYWPDLKDSGALVVDSSRVTELPKGGFKIYHLPIIETAKDQIGKAVVANIVSLGVITAISGVVSREAVEKAVRARVPKGTEELNWRALEAGFKLAHAQTG